jgi:hypothetical protein
MGTWRTEKLMDFIQAPRYGIFERGYSSTLLIYSDRDTAYNTCRQLNTRFKSGKEYMIINYIVKPVNEYGKEV